MGPPEISTSLVEPFIHGPASDLNRECMSVRECDGESELVTHGERVKNKEVGCLRHQQADVAMLYFGRHPHEFQTNLMPHAGLAVLA